MLDGMRRKSVLHGEGSWCYCEGKRAVQLRRQVEPFGQWLHGLDDAGALVEDEALEWRFAGILLL